jgi:hypothetical protein
MIYGKKTFLPAKPALNIPRAGFAFQDEVYSVGASSLVSPHAGPRRKSPHYVKAIMTSVFCPWGMMVTETTRLSFRQS